MVSSRIPTGDYKIQSVLYGTFWDVCDSTLACPGPFNNLFVNNEFNDVFQTFTVTALKNGYYTIQSLANGLYVTARESKNLDRTLYLAYEEKKKDFENQQFEFIRKSADAYVIVPRGIKDRAVEPPETILQELYLDKRVFTTTLQQFVFIPRTTILVQAAAANGVRPRP